jgi:hypothetical protein
MPEEKLIISIVAQAVKDLIAYKRSSKPNADVARYGESAIRFIKRDSLFASGCDLAGIDAGRMRNKLLSM